MTDIRAVFADAGLSLADLQTTIQQSEAIIGPLVGLGNSAGKTILNFDADRDPPANPAVLVKGSAGPAGAMLGCRDSVIIAGKTQAVSVFRPA